MDAEAAFKKIVNGVCVVTVKSGGKVNGMTAAWYTRVSHNPPLVMVSIAHTRHTLRMVEKSGYFCLNILAEGQLSLARNFGFASGKTVDKFEKTGYLEAESGSPILEDTAGYMDCRLCGLHEAGDHMLVVGELVETGTSEKKPMVADMRDFM